VGGLTLFAGLLLPWLGGALWLAFADTRGKQFPGNRWCQLGYGFFLGYAVLYFSILACNAVTGGVAWPPVMAFMGCFAAAGGVAWFLAPGSPSAGRPADGNPPERAQKILLAVFLTWTALHLAFICIEVFTQALYPWDAWLAWVYRAKAWYLAGAMTDVVGPAQWALASTAGTYTIDAWVYPLFPSVIPYWAALSLGHWSETLVNVPALFAGIAIGMALYGQCRQHGFGLAAGVLACYLLYSIPLFGTHIALAGYADLWMAGFCGLGFICVIRGSIAYRDGAGGPGLVLPGLLMLVMSITVKNEGVVWLLTALAFLLLANVRLRVAFALVLLLLLTTALCASAGISHLHLPLIGDIGVVEGRVLLPYIGSFRIEPHNVWKVYADNFLVMGNWNLFPLAVLAGLLLSLQSPLGKNQVQARRTGLAFTGLVIATQLFIFGMTDEGLWADTYTAVNRLVLHFVPALLFMVLVVVQSRLAVTTPGGRTEAARLTAAAAAAALIVACGVFYLLTRDLPKPPPAAVTFAADNYGFAFGHGTAAGGRMRVDRFSDGYALLTSGPVEIDAGDYPAIEYTWLPSGPGQQAAFFWRRQGDGNVQRQDLATSGTGVFDLSSLEHWRGPVTELGFLLRSPAGQPVELGAATLEPDTLALRLRMLWQGWSSFEEWSQRSINFLNGGAERQALSLPLLLAAWLLLGIAVLSLHGAIRRRHSDWLRSAVLLFFIAWVLLDLRWTVNNVRQARLSLQTAAMTGAQRTGAELDGEVRRYVRHLKKKLLGGKPMRILILGGPDSVDYYLLRAKYHLLPHSAYVTHRLTRALTPDTLDYVVYFGRPGTITQVPGWNTRWRNSLLEVDKGGMGAVYRIKKH